MPSLEMSDHLVLCNWSPRALEWIREVHSGIVADKRPVVIIHDNPDEVELPDKQDDPAFDDVYIVKGDPANEVILQRAKVPQAHSVVVLSDDRQEAARRRQDHRLLHRRQERLPRRAPAQRRRPSAATRSTARTCARPVQTKSSPPPSSDCG